MAPEAGIHFSCPAIFNLRPTPVFEGRNTMIRILPGSSVFSTLCIFLAAGCIALVAGSANAQTTRRTASHVAAAEDPSPLFNEYRGIQLGMTADDVRKKLGEPKDKGDEQDFYIFGETETAQIVYDKTKKVVTISADFLSASTEILTAKQVFGSEVEAKADGSLYRMVRFPKAGYWLSYNRTSGTSPLTTVTIQKIQ